MDKQQTDLCTPWSLHFDRDGTEDYGIIRDAEGEDIVASHLPGKQEDYGNTCWLPEADGDEMPTLVYQMKLMTAAPKLLDMLKIAVATADPTRHKWVKEAQAAIAEATGREFDAKEAAAARHLHKAAPRLYAALDAAYPVLCEYKTIAEAAFLLFTPTNDDLPTRIQVVRNEALGALAEAKGEIAF